MGKGIIKSGGDDGLYDVELTLHKDRVDDTIAIIDAQIEVLTTKIDGMEEGDAKELKKLMRASYQKRKDYINDNLPEDPTVSAWCGDLTEDLSGNVGTIEIPGERGIIQIQPGYEGGAAYDTTRDGQLQPAIANTPEGTFYNLAMLPGWQKWMPTYRHGIISNIDTDNDTCDVALDVVESSQQGLAVNQESNLSGIPIEYMSCNSSAFEDGDAVLVKFEGQEWSGAKVVGFKDNPKPCCLWTFNFPYSGVWPFSLEYESCVYLGAVQTPEFCAPWWSIPPDLISSGNFHSAFSYSELASVRSDVKQNILFTPEIRFGNTSPELYFIVDFADITITGSHPIGSSLKGMHFTFWFTWQHDDEVEPYIVSIGNIGSLTFLTNWSLFASGVYYDYFLRDLWGAYGPIDWDSEAEKWINTEGYVLKEFAVVARSASDSTGGGLYETDAIINFNSFKICSTYPANAIKNISFAFT